MLMARTRVAGLRQVRHRPDLDEAEAERGELPRDLPVLVEPRGQPDRVLKPESEPFERAERRAREATRRGAARAFRAERGRQRAQGELVRRLRLKPEERGA